MAGGRGEEEGGGGSKSSTEAGRQAGRRTGRPQVGMADMICAMPGWAGLDWAGVVWPLEDLGARGTGGLSWVGSGLNGRGKESLWNQSRTFAGKREEGLEGFGGFWRRRRGRGRGCACVDVVCHGCSSNTQCVLSSPWLSVGAERWMLDAGRGTLDAGFCRRVSFGGFLWSIAHSSPGWFALPSPPLSALPDFLLALPCPVLPCHSTNLGPPSIVHRPRTQTTHAHAYAYVPALPCPAQSGPSLHYNTLHYTNTRRPYPQLPLSRIHPASSSLSSTLLKTLCRPLHLLFSSFLLYYTYTHPHRLSLILLPAVPYRTLPHVPSAHRPPPSPTSLHSIAALRCPPWTRKRLHPEIHSLG
ncbi:hypothetical protein B0J11DRAFT_603496 [Dendryphion nanum]|uniref:Uncharacterized protein n=1 Tax=Dendryphion nanum TaxID=256645 RepID=A0A9P9IPZ7_9PLEO|nr:hypothetical protein B0J11DRAFT_603496 [Dendryphion nanum]